MKVPNPQLFWDCIILWNATGGVSYVFLSFFWSKLTVSLWFDFEQVRHSSLKDLTFIGHRRHLLHALFDYCIVSLCRMSLHTWFLALSSTRKTFSSFILSAKFERFFSTLSCLAKRNSWQMKEGRGGDEEALALLLVFINRVKRSNIKRYSF